MKVKVINKNINQQFDCEEVEIDGYKYYIDYFQPIEVGKWYISNQSPRLCVKIKEGKYPYIHLNNKGEEIADFYTWKGVIICSNNPNIDIPKVVDEVEDLDILKSKWYDNQEEDRSEAFVFQYSGIVDDALEKGIIIGYNKSQEMFPFTEEDMIEFAEWCQKPCLEDLRQPNVVYISSGNFYWYKHKKYTPKELLQLWKERNPKKVYYEN